MASDAKLPQCAAVDGCDSYGHPLRCESVATSQQTGLCDRHALRNRPLPIPTYDIHGYGVAGRAGHRSMSVDAVEAHPEHPGDWCKADDVRELLKMQIAADGARGSMMIDLRDRCCRAEAQRDRLKAAAVTLRNAALAMNRTQAVDEALGEVQSALAAIDKEPTT